MRTTIPVLLVFVFSLSTCHVVYTYFLSIYCDYSFTVRGPNIRHYPIKWSKLEQSSNPNMISKDYSRFDVYPLISAYLRSRFRGVENSNRMLVVGSSLSWGYPMSDQVSLSAKLQHNVEGDFVVGDASMIGANLERIHEILCNLSFQHLNPVTMFIEIPIINELNNVINMGGSSLSSDCEDGSRYKKSVQSYFKFFFFNPDGIASITRLRKAFYGRNGDRYMRNINIPEIYQFTHEQVEGKTKQLDNRIRAVFQQASAVGKKVIVFFSPIYRQAYLDLKVNDVHLDVMVNKVITICKDYKKVICIRPIFDVEQNISNFFTR